MLSLDDLGLNSLSFGDRMFRVALCRALGMAGLLLLTAGIAQSADLPPDPRPPKSIPTTSQFIWNGFYIGISGGFASGQTNWTNQTAGALTAMAGAIGGATAGYNWQASNWVFGLETDVSLSNLKGINGTSCLTGVCNLKNASLGTIRGRIGFATGAFLFYGTGGFAYGNVSFDAGAGSASAVRHGWTVGSGVELAVSRAWTAKLEYLHTDLGSSICGAGACASASPVDVNFSSNIVRAGLNYRF